MRPRRARPRPLDPASRREPAPTRRRFEQLDAYRAAREWARYEGTPQRELFRELRRRFVARHTARPGWVVDIGSGPGRFTPSIGAPGARRVAVDLSREMLLEIARRWPAGESYLPHRVLGDAVRPPLRPRGASVVVALGNPLGYAADDWRAALSSLVGMVAPEGVLVLETAPAPGEHSRYLRRLPPGAVGRLFAAPPPAIIPRIERDGFANETERHRVGAGFKRIDERELSSELRRHAMKVVEALSVAPALGADPVRIEAVHASPRSWERLITVEELLGRQPPRRARAAALLVAAARSATPAPTAPSGQR